MRPGEVVRRGSAVATGAVTASIVGRKVSYTATPRAHGSQKEHDYAVGVELTRQGSIGQ
jgi:hypothetical protein